MHIPTEIQLSMYESMVRQRLLDEKVVDLYKKGLISGIAYPCSGQEAVAAGVIANLSTDDLVVSNHRGHGHRAFLNVLMLIDADSIAIGERETNFARA